MLPAAAPAALALHSVSVQSAAARTSPTHHIVYEVKVRRVPPTDALSWCVWRRYSEFEALHKAFLVLFPDSPPPLPLPPKSSIPQSFSAAVGGMLASLTRSMSVTSAPSLEQDPAATDKVEARRHSLERYLQAILEAPDSRWRESGPWSVFLDIPAHASTSALSAGRGFDISHALNNVATASELLRPDRWLAECKLVSDECRNVREAIVRKDSLAAAGNASAMHTALIQIRARVASLTDRVGHLDQALRTINSRNRNAPFAAGYLHSASSTTGKAKDDIPLSADDVQRYEDLLVNLKAEKDRIVKLLSTSAQSASHSKSSFGDISVSEELLGSRSSASPRPSTNRRAFGVGRETDQTRALDNNGLLLLQQKTISEQDQMLESLSTVIRRQKELGTTVGVEIEEQTQMLGELGDGIDAVSGNLKHATKKLDRVRGGKR